MRSLNFWENLVLGEKYLLDYKNVYKLTSVSPRKIEEYQFNKIKQLVSLAYHNTKFYHNLYAENDIHPEDIKTWADFKNLPTISKEDLMKNHDTCINKDKKDDNLIISRSSGSSGQIVDINFDGESWADQALIMLRMYQQAFQYKPNDKQALIYTSQYPYRSILGFYKANYIYNLTPSDQIIHRLQKLKPAIIVAYPSILMELINNYEDKCKDLSLKAISTNSEQSTQKERDYISEIFGCPVFDEYSTEELTLVGYQCKKHNYHLQEDASYIEILDPDHDTELKSGEVGEIVGTCLVNNVMPLIRYRQGDLGAIKDSDCSCGNNFRLLSDIAGRKDNSFILPNGSVIPSGRILDWTYKLILDFKLPILQFQVIQRTIQSIEVTIVPTHSYKLKRDDRIIIDSFIKAFDNHIEVKVIKKTSIPKTPVGKHIAILSLVAKEKRA